MRWLVLLFICLSLLQCTQDSIVQERVIKIEDTTKLSSVKKFLKLQKEINSILTTDSILSEELSQKSRQIDTLINNILDLKSDKLDNTIVIANYDRLASDKATMLHKAVIADSINTSLIKRNRTLSDQLDMEIELKKKILKDNYKLKETFNRATKLEVTALKLTGIGSAGLITKRDFVTTKSKEIRKVRVSFTFPANEFTKKEFKQIKCVLRSTDKMEAIRKDTIVDYDGKEVNVEVLMNTKRMEPGKHNFFLTINSTSEYKYIFLVN